MNLSGNDICITDSVQLEFNTPFKVTGNEPRHIGDKKNGKYSSVPKKIARLHMHRHPKSLHLLKI